jgi:1-deoxy-D-xylulose-5-phosphate synthase
VVFAVDRAGFVGEDGETHQGVYDISFMRNQPHMVIMMPKDENELQHMLYTAVRYDDGPIAVRYSKANGVGVPMDQEFREIPIGKAEVLRQGNDVALLALGPMVQAALKAADKLAEQGIQARVINARFAKPLDEALLDQLAMERIPLITVEEACIIGGFGSAVLEYYAAKEVRGMHVKLLGVPDCYVEHGTIEDQRRETGLQPDQIAEKVSTYLARIKQQA